MRKTGEVLSIKDLSFSFAGSKQAVLSNISFSVYEGEMLCLCGATGSGKTTLLRMLKKELHPLGDLQGKIMAYGKELSQYDEQKLAFLIGYVGQDPDHFCVTDQVYRELAFGLENMGVDSSEIKRRVAEMATYFGMESWLYQKTNTLSGGQKQLLSLACVLITNPSILLVDEPTSQLDPIAAAEFLKTIEKINRELGITVIIVEHRLENVLFMCDRVLLLDAGELAYLGDIANMPEGSAVENALPLGMQLFHACLDKTDLMPKSMAETRQFIKKHLEQEKRNGDEKLSPKQMNDSNQIIDVSKKKTKESLVAKHVWASYEKNGKEVVRDFAITLYPGEIYCLLGGNGSGKTSALKALCGLMPYSNLKKENTRIGFLPQDVETVFLADSVGEDFERAGINIRKLEELQLPLFSIERYLNMHPYDLSGGEKQKVALTKLFALNKEIYLLDEPAKGLDAKNRDLLIKMLFQLKDMGKTILLVTHDVELAAKCGDKVGLFFQGEIISEDIAAAFFAKNAFFTTQACLATKGICSGIYQTDQLLSFLKEEGGSVCTHLQQ